MTGDSPNRILLIDGHAMAFRAFFALPAESFTDGSGQATNAVYGFMGMLFNLVTSEEPTHVAVAFDLPGGTFRTTAYGEYKAGRDETPAELEGQFALLEQTLDALGVRWLTYPDYEADDIVATLAARAAGDGGEALIVTSDRDALQLVGDAVTVLQPRKGVQDLNRMTPAAVAEKYGVSPEQYPDLAALVGEVADNLPGVPGVGPKTAAKWIGQYGSLDGVITHADEIKGKAGQNLRDHLDDVLRNRRLNAAVTDLELPSDPDEYALGKGSLSAVHQIFDALRFGGIRSRVPAPLLGEDQLAAEAAATHEEARDLDALELLGGPEVAEVLAGDAAGGAAIAVDGRWTEGRGEAGLLALAAGDRLVAVDLAGLDQDADAALGAWLADPTIPKRVFDGKQVWHLLTARGLRTEGLTDDVSLAEFVCRPDQRAATLPDLALRVLGRSLAEEETGQQSLDLTAAPDDAARAARPVAAAADAVDALLPGLRDELEELASVQVYADVELPLVEILARMEHVGIQVDTAVFDDLDATKQAQQEQAQERAYAEIGEDRINLGSPKQLQQVLFERLEMPRTRKTKTGFSTDAEALQGLFEQTGHPFLAALLEHRDVTKMRQIIETLRKTVTETGRIHTTFRQNVAATGRLSSQNPNLQNIPARTPEGRRIRDAFVASTGFESLMTVDYSQIEMRIMAHLSGDAGLIEAFRTGEDLHRFVASRVYGIPAAQVDPDTRNRVKAISYGLAYGLSAFGLGRQLRLPQSEANELRDSYFERFGGVRDYLRTSVDAARKDGYTETILGRRRYLPDLTSTNRQRRENAERVALNAPIQGSAADIIKLAMLRVDRELARQELASRVLLQVHDELVLEVAPGETEQLTELVTRAMGAAYELSVPLEVSVGTGASWHEAAH